MSYAILVISQNRIKLIGDDLKPGGNRPIETIEEAGKIASSFQEAIIIDLDTHQTVPIPIHTDIYDSKAPEGVCICGSDDLEHGDTGLNGTTNSYSIHCNKCGLDFTEDYNLVWCGKTLKNRPTNLERAILHP